jgi:CO/xanthine dehydrogenase FAD-binding subunit
MDLVAVEEIVAATRAALDDWGHGDAWLAGGTWMFSQPQPAVRRLHDLTALDWPAITADADGIELAATCTLAELAAWPVPARWPGAGILRPCCEALLGSFKVWQAATVGGNLCLALAAAPMAALAVALEGVCEVWGPDGGARQIAALELITGPGTTSLRPGELLRSMRLPRAALEHDVAVRQASLAPLGRSAALVIGRRSSAGELVVTITAAVPRPAQVRCDRPPTAAELAGALAPIAAHPYDDVHGDPRWRAHLIGLLAEEVRAELEERAG